MKNECWKIFAKGNAIFGAIKKMKEVRKEGKKALVGGKSRLAFNEFE